MSAETGSKPKLLLGQEEATIDDKGRVLVAKNKRDRLGSDFVMRLGDNGCIYPTGLATHRECALRAVHGGIGHLVDHERYCYGERDPDAGLTKRQSSVLVWRHVVDKLPVGEAELELASS